MSDRLELWKAGSAGESTVHYDFMGALREAQRLVRQGGAVSIWKVTPFQKKSSASVPLTR